MNHIGAVLTGLLLVVGQLTATVQQHVSAVHRGLTEPLTQVVGHVTTLKQRLADIAQRGNRLGDQPPVFIQVPSRGRTILIPAECRFDRNRYDVVLHFHGANSTVEPIVERAKINAVFVILNWGIGSGAYEDRFADPGALDRMLAAVDQQVDEQCQNDSLALGRLALSAWSAGYGAVGRILSREAEAARVDAVLLSDGLHTGYEPGKKSELNSLQMEPFTLFSYEAVAGEKLMVVTHSAIVPPNYASTTQTADYLLKAHGMKRKAARIPAARPGMVLTSFAEQSGFFVRGYDGGDAPAHCHHLYGMGETVLPLLRAHWESR
jgi:hypothetical protein